MRQRVLPIACLLVIVLVATAFKTIPALKRSTPGRIVRWCLGEPGATQDVNDDADKIISSDWGQELIALSDELIEEYGSTVSTLPEALGATTRLLPLDRLPPKFRTLGGTWGDPELLLRLDNTSTPTAIVLGWGNTRHTVVIYAQPPEAPPEGFFVRRVNDRIYVVANED